MPYTSPNKYKEGKTKEITLPSLLTDGSHPVFVIKKPSPRVLIQLLNALDVDQSADINAEEMTKALEEKFATPEGQSLVLDALDTLITGSVIQPKVVVGPAGDDEISTDDIDLDDQKTIMDEVLKFTSIGKEGEDERKKLPAAPSGA